jgi:hypothetical protein
MAANQQSAREDAGHTADRAQSHWQQVRAETAAKMRGFHDSMGRKRDQLDVKQAQGDAEAAEGDAVDALDFAAWAIEQAEVAVLDAVDARAWAYERAATARPS